MSLWRRVLGAALSAALALPALAADAPFRGKIRFEGNYVTSTYVTARRKMERNYGPIVIELQFDGAKVSGTYRGEGGLDEGRLTGTVANGMCTLRDQDGDRWHAPCGPNGFQGETDDLHEHGGQAWTTVFNTRATSVTPDQGPPPHP